MLIESADNVCIPNLDVLVPHFENKRYEMKTGEHVQILSLKSQTDLA